ncbi:MAG: hypothetical protein K2P17_08100 [Helicobacteraceae bacterium]|nr:hypothetical protein [Helicobacteraceae bacterium]
MDSNVVSNEDSGIESSYVGFVDSDDVIAKDYFRNLIYTLEINKVQISKSSDIEIFDTNNYNSKAFYLEQKKTKGKIHIIKKNNITKLEVWRCVFEYNLIKNLKFHKLLAEDIVFNFCAHALARKIAINKNARYFYRQRNGSIMKAGSNGNTKGSTMESFREIFYFLRDNNLLQTFDLPTAFIRPKLEYTSKKDEDFLEMKKNLKDLNIPKYIVQNNKILNAAFSANSAKEFIAKTSSLKEKFKQYFQFRISKKQNIVKFFGKVIYSNKRL